MHRTCTPEKTTRNASHTGVGEVTRSISNVARLVDTARSQLAAVRATAPVGAAGPASVLQLPLPLHLHFRHTGLTKYRRIIQSWPARIVSSRPRVGERRPDCGRPRRCGVGLGRKLTVQSPVEL